MATYEAGEIAYRSALPSHLTSMCPECGRPAVLPFGSFCRSCGATLPIELLSSPGSARGGREAPTRLQVDLAEARAHLATVRPTGDPVALATALVWVGGLEFYCGDLRAADRSFAEVEGLISDDGVGVADVPIAMAARARLRSLRGAFDDARSGFDRALACARAGSVPAMEAIVLVFRAASMAAVQPDEALADARAARAELERLGNAWWAREGLVAEVIALLACGEPTPALAGVESLLARPVTPMDRAFALQLAGRAHLALGDREAAADALREAEITMEEAGARYWLVETLLLLADAEPTAAAEPLGRAKRLSTDDPAYVRLWADRPVLRVEVLPATPRVLVGGRRAEFRARRSEMLVYLLALAGPDGVDAERLCGQLWPGTPSKRARPRLRTAVWDARLALGTEAWRIRRTPNRLVLDLEGAEFDRSEAALVSRPVDTSDEEVMRARTEAVEALARPILPGWSFSD